MIEKLPDKQPDQPDKDSVTRRVFIGGAGAVFVSRLLGVGASHGEELQGTRQAPHEMKSLDAPTREKIIKSALNSISPAETERILEGGSDEEIADTLRKWPEFLTRAEPYFADTTFDPMPAIQAHGFPSIQIRDTDLAEHIERGAHFRVGSVADNTYEAQSLSGNAFVVEYEKNGKTSQAVFTNEHVATPLGLPVFSDAPEDVDIAAINMPVMTRGLPRPLKFEPRTLPKTLTGALVFNPVVKADPGTPHVEKVRVGVALRVTPHLVDFLMRQRDAKTNHLLTEREQYVEDVMRSMLLRSYMVLAPAWEQAEQRAVRVVAGAWEHMRFSFAQATSGSPWVMIGPDKKMQLVGVHSSGALLTAGVFGTKAVGASFFYGPDAIQKVVDSITDK